MAEATTRKTKPKTGERKTPRYLQVAGELREAIIQGKYRDGRAFPTETVLCDQFDVSRFTVREALKRLEAEGLISRRRGSGTTVQPAAARGGALHQPLSNVGELLQYARGSAVIYKPGGTAPLPTRIAEQIALDTGGQWTVFSGVRQQGYGEPPIALTDAYFHERLGDTIDKLDLNASSRTLFSQIEQLAGITVGQVTQDIQAIAADKPTAKALDMTEGEPVLLILRCYRDIRGNLFEISVSHHPGNRFAYAMHIDVDG